jgi:hypothetical protein
MTNSDDYVGWVSQGTTTLLDTYAVGQIIPAYDTQQDASLIGSSQVNPSCFSIVSPSLPSFPSHSVPYSSS